MGMLVPFARPGDAEAGQAWLPDGARLLCSTYYAVHGPPGDRLGLVRCLRAC